MFNYITNHKKIKQGDQHQRNFSLPDVASFCRSWAASERSLNAGRSAKLKTRANT